MEAKTLQVFLRVLYTVNNNPQYILAKSSSQVPAIPCDETTTQPATNEPAYARASLNACLSAVCDSSPELLQDPTRDFSLYFLDPLEAQPFPTGLAQAPQSTCSPRGVAVALGLMSWAIESGDSTNVFVTGTIVPNALLALEVVCALRETKRIPKPMIYSHPPPSYPVYPLQPAGMSWSDSRLPVQQQTLTRSADFPEVYIGPPRRARGRPEGSTSKSKVKAQASTSSLSVSYSSDAVNDQTESKQPSRSASKQRAKPRPPRPPPTYSSPICAPLARVDGTAGSEPSIIDQRLHSTNQSQNEPYTEPRCQAQSQLHPTHNPLLALISAISSASATTTDVTPEQQAALISTLQGLLVANPNLGLPANVGGTATRVAHGSNAGSNSAIDECDDGDSDVVVLDSSTIDTTMFHKGSTRERATSEHNTSSLIANQESPMASEGAMDSSPLPESTPPSAQNTSVSSQTSTPSETLELTLTATVDSETPKHDSSGRVGVGDMRFPDMPSTPTPSRTRKRKMDEYTQGQAHWSMPTFPPSPSPTVTRTSSSGRAGTTKSRVQPSPIGGTTSISSPSMRLPSMLGSMRGALTSNSMSQSCPSGSLMHTSSAPFTITKNGNRSTTLLTKSGAAQAITLDASWLKRRRTLTEFMAEREALQSLQGRKQSSSRHKWDVSANLRSHVAPSRPALSSTLKYAQSSPPRPLFRSSSMASGFQSTTSTSIVSSGAISNPALSSMTTLTSMRPSISTDTQTKNPLKNFVVPAWARTSTAMLPRLSEEALARQRAEQEAKKAQVSLRRREAARAKRKQLHRADHPSKDSSDEDEITTSVAERRLLSSSLSTSRNAPAPPPTLPVFASDVVAPIASSPPPSRRQPVSPTVPSTPPRKPMSLFGSGSNRTPSKPGSCSLFTPSGQDQMSLFTPSTPSVTRSQSRVGFTPHSPTALRRLGGANNSPTKGILQTPRTPRRKDGNHHTPKSLRANKQLQFTSPSISNHTPQIQTGMAMRPFLLPPSSPCAPRTPQRPKRVFSLSSTMLRGSGAPQQPPATGTHTQNVQPEDIAREDRLSRDLDDALREEDMMILRVQCRPSPANDELDGIHTSGGTDPAEREYASSPLPPSSPLPVSPPSSPGPVKHDADLPPPVTNGQQAVDLAWLLSDDTADPTAACFTDSDAGAWLTETEAWLTDTENGPLPTDSDGAWLSDSDAVSTVFGNLASSLPNWLSDADVETDGEGGTRAMSLDGFDTAVFEKAYEAFAEHGNTTSGLVATHPDTEKERTIEPDFWESVIGERNSTLNHAGTAAAVSEDIQVLLDGLVAG